MHVKIKIEGVEGRRGEELLVPAHKVLLNKKGEWTETTETIYRNGFDGFDGFDERTRSLRPDPYQNIRDSRNLRGPNESDPLGLYDDPNENEITHPAKYMCIIEGYKNDAIELTERNYLDVECQLNSIMEKSIININAERNDVENNMEGLEI